MNDFGIFFRGDLDSQTFAKKVAEVLRSGTASEKFMMALANLFDPPARPRGVFAVTVERRRKGRPKKLHNEALGRAMVQAMSVREPQILSKTVAGKIAQEHGASVSAAYAAWRRQKELDTIWEELQKKR